MRTLTPDILAVGAIDWDRRIFDELIPLPEGTSYNAYLVKGSEKTALIDTVDPGLGNILIDNLVKAGVSNIDYIISHHCEQDHSGSIPDILLLYPDARVVTNPKCKEFLEKHLHIDEDKFITVDDGQELSLGNKTLRFIYTPWVHWPETMCTYLREDKVLFSCDFFGSHLAGSSLFVQDECAVYPSAKRYFAEIMMPFRPSIRTNLEKVSAQEIAMIAPSHGPVYKRPEFIMDAYRDWVGDEVKNQVVLPYISMHHSTRRMVEHFIDSLMERNIEVKPFNLVHVDLGELAMALVDAATVVIGTPTVLVGPHPVAAYAALLTNALRPKTRFLSILGSYGWAGKMPEQIKGLLTNLKAEFLDPVIVRGLPTDEDLLEVEDLAEKILAKHREIGIVNK